MWRDRESVYVERLRECVCVCREREWVCRELERVCVER